MTEVRQGPTPCVHFRGVCFNEVSGKRQLTAHCTVFLAVQWPE